MILYSIITHIAGWILFLSLPILFVGNQSGGSDFWSILFSWNALLFFTTYMSIFYLNSYFLIPQLYAKKKWFLYALSLLILLAGVWALGPYDRLINKMSNRYFANPYQHPSPGRFKPSDRPFREPGYDELDELPPGPPIPPDTIGSNLLVSAVSEDSSHNDYITNMFALQPIISICFFKNGIYD